MTKVIVEKIATLAGHRDSIYTLERSVAPSRFYSASGDGMVVEWDLAVPKDGHLIVQVPNSVYSLCLNEKKETLLVGQNFSGIHEIDVKSRQEIRSLAVTDAAIFDIATYEDYIFIATGDGTIVVVSDQDFSVLQRIQLSHERVRSLEIDEQRKLLLAGYSDNTIRVFDLSELKLLQTLEGHENSVLTVVKSLDGAHLLSAGRDAQIRVWDLNSFECEKKIPAHMYAINNIVYSPDATMFASCSMDKSIKVWDAHSFQLMKVIDKARHAGHGTSVNKLLWSKYNNYIVSGSDDRSIAVWQLKLNM